MEKIYFTPGPSQLFPTVPGHIRQALADDIASVSHRGETFKNIFAGATQSLKKLLNIPEEFHVFFLGSASEAMERVIANCVKDKSFHFVNGAFSERFYQTALDLKKSPQTKIAKFGRGFDFNSREIPEDAELICFTQNETSSGALVPVEEIHKIRQSHPHALLAVDIVSSAPYVDLDFTQVDVVFFSVQKGMGLPAGLGVLLVNEKCMNKTRQLQEQNCNLSANSFLELAKYEEKLQTPATPNVLGIYLLGKVCGDMIKIGIGKIRQHIEEKTNLLYDFFDNHPNLKPFVTDKNIRSQTVITINTPDGSKPITDKLREQGLVVGAGYKNYKDSQIRIANFPAHSLEDCQRIIEILK